MTEVERAKKGERVFANVYMRSVRKSETLGGGRALEVGDVCLVEDGSERGGALCSNAVVFEAGNH